MTGTDAPTTRTTSPTAAHFRHFSPRWSALWALHHLESRPHRHPIGGIARHEGPTRRRHAPRGLHVVQNPHYWWCGGRRKNRTPGRSASKREKTRPAPPLHRPFREKVRPASTKTPNLRCF